MKKFFILLLLFIYSINCISNDLIPEYSKAGYFEVKESGREVYNFNLGWRIHKGDVENAQQYNFDDSKWNVINCPNGIEYDPSEASGCVNYQGVVWYRKHFKYEHATDNKNLKLHFEAVMGKCKVWLNGELLAEHYGGYLPFSVDLSGKLKKDTDNVLAVWADNSDDPNYPPGKEQSRLDFTYFGGIYRDVWLVSTNKVYVTNPNEVDRVAGGGVFLHTKLLSDNLAEVSVKVDIQNDDVKSRKISANMNLLDMQGNVVAQSKKSVSVSKKGFKVVQAVFTVENPKLWTPWSPTLYRFETLLTDENGKTIDGIAIKYGIRTVELKGRDGFYLNGKPYPGKLIGANRHQDHAYVGNALPNNRQWHDAWMLKNAGCDVIRTAHYPSDPAFMDACDALGLFYIEATPGWQFWNDENPLFEQRVYDDIRNMVRRVRNYAAIFMWEPILNESNYPPYFAKNAHDAVHEEYPYQGAYTSSDQHVEGQEYLDAIYGHVWNTDYVKHDRCYFQREWGDNVDEFWSQNSTSRVERGWGEEAQLIQAAQYAEVPYKNLATYESICETPRQFIGGALWCGFDHQRGYHSDPFYGGLTDVFRQPKYSYYMFKSQRSVEMGGEPMVYIAHEMTPFSGKDVTVYTNCDQVRLTLYNGEKIILKNANGTTYKKPIGVPKLTEMKEKNIPHPIVVFEDAFDINHVKNLSRWFKAKDATIMAEGLIDGKVVARDIRVSSKRPEKIKLTIEENELPLIANGSDFILVTASIVDRVGNMKRLNNQLIKFEVEGEGYIIGDEQIGANPRQISWGTAPALIKSTNKAGKITIKAYLLDGGPRSPLPAELVIETVSSDEKFIFTEVGEEHYNTTVKKEVISQDANELMKKVRELEKQLLDINGRTEQRIQQEYEENR